MVIDKEIIEEIAKKAIESQKLRANLCLHESQDDRVQAMVNVMQPGTQVQIHRHLYTNEILAVLSGTITILYYNSTGDETERFELSTQDKCIINIPKGQWHNMVVNETVVLLEVKEGPYRALLKEEIIQ